MRVTLRSLIKIACCAVVLLGPYAIGAMPSLWFWPCWAVALAIVAYAFCFSSSRAPAVASVLVSIALAIALAIFAITFYTLTIVKMGPALFDRAL